MAIGPELPPHLIKRKREDHDNEEISAPRQPYRDLSRSPSSNGHDKRRRVLGPSLPPALLDKRPISEPAADDSDSDDGFGPAPPPLADLVDQEAEQWRTQALEAEIAAQEATKKPQREEWMLAPPDGSDWSSRVDPTKLRNRKFNTGKGAKAPAQKGPVDNVLWTETPEQKRKRLEDEVMGIKKPSQLDMGSQKSARSEAEAQETERRIRDYNEKNRNSSLYTEHQKTTPRDKEDDPSKRAFDREKDIAGGVKISHAKKKEMLNRAADFGSRFSKGSYL